MYKSISMEMLKRDKGRKGVGEVWMRRKSGVL